MFLSSHGDGFGADYEVPLVHESFSANAGCVFSITETGSGTDYQVPLSEGFGPSVGQESQSNFVHELFMNCSCIVHNPTEAWLSRPERKTTKRRMRGKQLEAKEKDRDIGEQEDRKIWATIASRN